MTLRNDAAPRKYYYKVDKHMFEELPDGLVRVTDVDGRSGIFTWDGRFVEGELSNCSLQMLVWCGGPTIPKACSYRWPEVPADITRPSGWPEELERILPHQMGKW